VFEAVGASVINARSIAAQILWLFGRFCEFSARAMYETFVTSPWRAKFWRLVVPQSYEVGFRTVPVILITGTFVGLVLAVSSVAQFKSVGVEDRIGVVINISIVRELGPVLAAVMLAGRIGGALTAELGTMNVTEQIDALRCMGADPMRYLVAPRFLACLFFSPVLTIYCDLMGFLGGWFIAVVIHDIATGPYWDYSAAAIEWFDLITGFLKSVIFGGSIGLISCYKGFHCRPGAEGVGRACTEAFVSSFIAILILDFFIAYFMQALYSAIWGFKSII